MLDYRLYLLDAAGHITKAVEIEAPSDDAALAHCQNHESVGGVELWQRTRFVRRLPDRTPLPGGC